MVHMCPGPSRGCVAALSDRTHKGVAPGQLFSYDVGADDAGNSRQRTHILSPQSQIYHKDPDRGPMLVG